LKGPRKIKGNKIEREDEFLDDILDLEDMEYPIELFDAMTGSVGASDTDDESETERDSSESNKEGYTDPLDEHLLMVHNGHGHGVAENVVNTAHVMVHNTEYAVSSSHISEAAVVHNVVHEQAVMEYGESASRVLAHSGGHEQGAADYAVIEAQNEHAAADYSVNHVMPHNGGHEQEVKENVVCSAHMMAHNGGHQQDAEEYVVSAPPVMAYNGCHEHVATKYVVSASCVMMPQNRHEQEVTQNHVVPHNGDEQGVTDCAVRASQVMAHNTHEQAANQYPVSTSHVMAQNDYEQGASDYVVGASHVMAQNGYEQGTTDYVVGASHFMAHNSHEQAATEYPVSPSHFISHDGSHEQGQNIVSTSCVTAHDGDHPHDAPHNGGHEQPFDYAVESAHVEPRINKECPL
jgi:hypothetical protein